jgi:tetratricopeptide (TPR) repeat protein
VPAPGADEARAAVADGDAKLAAGDAAGALAAYGAALPQAAGVPALHMAMAKALASAGRAQDAMGQYRGALEADPTYAPAHLGLAEIYEKANNLPAARRELVEALAYHPPSPRALELLKKLVGGAAGGVEGGWYDPPPSAPGSGGGGRRGEPFPIFLDVDAAGAIHVAAAKGDAAQIYGGCRAVLRYEPELRAQIFQQPREQPYTLSVAEEVICIEAALGAYAAGKGDTADPAMDDLLRIAREEGLSGYVMFEILGQHRPEWARKAPADVHRETAAYLMHWVLSQRPAPPVTEGVYTAER